MKLSASDCFFLKDNGYLNCDIDEIKSLVDVVLYGRNDESISARQAVTILGKKVFLLNLAKCVFSGFVLVKSVSGDTISFSLPQSDSVNSNSFL